MVLISFRFLAVIYNLAVAQLFLVSVFLGARPNSRSRSELFRVKGMKFVEQSRLWI